MSNSAQFMLSITKALGDQLTEAIDDLKAAPLDEDELSRLKAERGVYQLYHHNKLVYIGKAEESLPYRLGQHRRKISGRRLISLQDMTFTCLYVEENLSVLAPETLLINRHRANGALPWNKGGFGPNDPGRERDTTRLKATNFDAQYPIRLDWPCDALSGEHSVLDLLRRLKDHLPYTFRYQEARRRTEHQPADYRDTTVVIPPEATAVDVFEALKHALPAGWQITALHGYVIMYHEDKHYTAALQTFRS